MKASAQVRTISPTPFSSVARSTSGVTPPRRPMMK
jgi:hypothetical protein